MKRLMVVAAIAVLCCGVYLSCTSKPDGPPEIPTPVVNTGASANVTGTSAELRGSVNPQGVRTFGYFVYGPAGELAAQAAVVDTSDKVDFGSGTSAQTRSVTVGNLTPGIEYEYRLIAYNVAEMTEGPLRSFTTEATAPRVCVDPETVDFRFSQCTDSVGAHTVQVTNCGAGSLSWQAEVNVNWLSVNPEMAVSDDQVVDINVTQTCVEPGDYSAQVVFRNTSSGDVTATSDSAVVAVNVTVDPPSQQTGTIRIRVLNQAGLPPPSAEVVRYNQNWDMLDSRQTDANGYAVWNDAPADSLFHFQVYVPAAVDGEAEFWAEAVDVSVGPDETTQLTMPRQFPFAADIMILDATEDAEITNVVLGDTVRLVAQVFNPSPTPVEYWVTVQASQDTHNVELEETSNHRNIEGNTERPWVVPFIPLTAGEYRVRCWKVMADPFGEGDEELTDSWFWSQSRSFSVTAPEPVIQLDTDSLYFTADSGGTVPEDHQFTITNIGDGELDWSVSTDQSWLSVAPNTGAGNSATITTHPNTTELSPGTHEATITVSSANATNSPQEITVVYEVNSVATAPVISLEIDNLFFEADSGGDLPPEQTFELTNSGGGTLDWIISSVDSWISIDPTSGSSNAATISIQPTSTDFPPGTLEGTFTVSSSNATNSPQTVVVQYDIRPVDYMLVGGITIDNCIIEHYGDWPQDLIIPDTQWLSIETYQVNEQSFCTWQMDKLGGIVGQGARVELGFDATIFSQIDSIQFWFEIRADETGTQPLESFVSFALNGDHFRNAQNNVVCFSAGDAWEWLGFQLDAPGANELIATDNSVYIEQLICDLTQDLTWVRNAEIIVWGTPVNPLPGGMRNENPTKRGAPIPMSDWPPGRR